jgi:polar amino acid transport system ATP-binding protein
VVRQYHALVDVSERVAKGEVVVVCGPSGSGKSTLIRTLNRLEHRRRPHRHRRPRHPCARHRRERLRAGIGFVFQQFNLFPHLTVLENCTLAPMSTCARSRSKEAKERALELLDRVGLAHKANAYPDELSGGQQQRVAIARALAMRRRSCCSTSRPARSIRKWWARCCW